VSGEAALAVASDADLSRFGLGRVLRRHPAVHGAAV